jgi:hypothetical protein
VAEAIKDCIRATNRWPTIDAENGSLVILGFDLALKKAKNEGRCDEIHWRLQSARSF